MRNSQIKETARRQAACLRAINRAQRGTDLNVEINRKGDRFMVTINDGARTNGFYHVSTTVLTGIENLETFTAAATA